MGKSSEDTQRAGWPTIAEVIAKYGPALFGVILVHNVDRHLYHVGKGCPCLGQHVSQIGHHLRLLRLEIADADNVAVFVSRDLSRAEYNALRPIDSDAMRVRAKRLVKGAGLKYGFLHNVFDILSHR